MIDLTGLTIELNKIGDFIYIDQGVLRTGGMSVDIIYNNITEDKAQVDSIVSTFLVGFTINSTLENGEYKASCFIKT
tara:strand:+ start:700 stop:930 length:231 start_codon:yes stop_codon:yes gene_type:complete